MSDKPRRVRECVYERYARVCLCLRAKSAPVCLCVCVRDRSVRVMNIPPCITSGGVITLERLARNTERQKQTTKIKRKTVGYKREQRYP